jgi:hypothetical protein
MKTLKFIVAFLPFFLAGSAAGAAELTGSFQNYSRVK